MTDRMTQSFENWRCTDGRKGIAGLAKRTMHFELGNVPQDSVMAEIRWTDSDEWQEEAGTDDEDA
jgi:hypothetical protein